MVEQPTKPLPTSLPTWWLRGPSGLVEEWETRVSEEEINRRQNRWRTTSSANAKSSNNSRPRSWSSLFPLPEFSSYHHRFLTRLCKGPHSQPTLSSKSKTGKAIASQRQKNLQKIVVTLRSIESIRLRWREISYNFHQLICYLIQSVPLLIHR